MEDGFKVYTASSYELIPQSVSAVSCVPIGGSSSQTMFTTSVRSATPPYPTAPTVSSAGENGTTAVFSAAGASNTAVTPGGGGDLVPFTGGAAGVRKLCSIPSLALLVRLWAVW